MQRQIAIYYDGELFTAYIQKDNPATFSPWNR